METTETVKDLCEKLVFSITASYFNFVKLKEYPLKVRPTSARLKDRLKARDLSV